MIKTVDGHIRKENPQVTLEIQNNINKYRLAINRATVLETLKDHPGWKSIQEVINARIKVVDKYLENFSEKDDRYNALRLQEKKDLKFFVSIVDDFINSVPDFEKNIQVLEKSLNDRKSNAES